MQQKRLQCYALSGDARGARQWFAAQMQRFQPLCSEPSEYLGFLPTHRRLCRHRNQALGLWCQPGQPTYDQLPARPAPLELLVCHSQHPDQQTWQHRQQLPEPYWQRKYPSKSVKKRRSGLRPSAWYLLKKQKFVVRQCEQRRVG